LKYTSLPNLEGRKKPYIIAHRGNKVNCPENTLAAFARAIKDGADILETDLHVTSDGQFVCIHDSTVDRTTNGSGQVEDMTLKQVRRFSASYGQREFESERIPLLEEVVQIMPENMGLALELKSDRFLDEETCRALYQLLKKLNIHSRTIVLSFSTRRLEAMAKHVPQLPSGLISLSRLRPYRSTQLVGPFWPILLLNPRFVKTAHKRNQAVAPLDPNPDSRLWLYVKLGCDAVLTDNPASTFEALKEYR